MGLEEGQDLGGIVRGEVEEAVDCEGFGFDGVGCSEGQPYCDGGVHRHQRNEQHEFVGSTHAGVEGEVVEGAVVEKTGFVLRDTVADLERRVDGGCRALERREVVELRYRHRVADPFEELLGRDDPDCNEAWRNKLTSLGTMCWKPVPSDCSCAQSRKLLIMSMVDFDAVDPGTES